MQNNSSAGKYGRVVILPQDHMPCVVPDTNGLAKMPNAWTGVTIPYAAPYHPIPNPGLPKVQLFKNSSPGIPSK
jgi:hypothetical protein